MDETSSYAGVCCGCGLRVKGGGVWFESYLYHSGCIPRPHPPAAERVPSYSELASAVTEWVRHTDEQHDMGLVLRDEDELRRLAAQLQGAGLAADEAGEVKP